MKHGLFLLPDYHGEVTFVQVGNLTFTPTRQMNVVLNRVVNSVARSDAGQGELQSNGGDGWYSSVGQGNWFFSAIATGLSNTAGSFRLGTTKQGFSPKYYGNAWRGNQYATTYNIGKIGKFAGRLSFAIGVAADIKGVINYYDNPNSPNAVHPGKAGVNTAMGIWGFTGVGTVPAIFYFGSEAFYPGGALQLFNDSGKWHDDTKRILGPG